MRKLVILLSLMALLAVVGGTTAQDATEAPESAEMGDAAQMAPIPAPENAIVTDLAFPRGLTYGEDGILYVAEAGTGGDTVVGEFDGQTFTGGLSGKVTAVAADGTTSTALANLPSVATFEGGLGLYRAYQHDGSWWLVMSDVGPMMPFGDSIVEVDESGYVHTYIDLHGFEAENNPDGTEEILSNPADIAWTADGTLLIADAGANALLTWTRDGGLELFHAWTDNPVPTGVEVAENGDIYVSFLGEGIAPGAAHIERWSADGELLETFSGLSAVTDVLLADDGTVYAVELVQFGEQGPIPGSGRVVEVTAEGATPVLEGLSYPFGLAQSPEGQVVVSVGSTLFGPPAVGAVVPVTGGA